ncbi:MAG TPA: DPP IV N-terminal domain-containing protein [Vicinamibacterales bacterium]|nr:DPP IV N-terminal domain-containing protein [Vicinamibacterales bacterium]
MFHHASARVGLCMLAVALTVPASLRAQKAEPAAPPAPNYDLAAQWTSQKVGKLVFDTTVTPRWLEHSDRFWYTYQTRDGRKFWFVDPIKKTKAPLFDHAKMAATLTTITRIPYDAQHLPFSNVRFVKKDTAFEFDVQVPADAVINAPAKRDTTTEQGAAVRQPEADQPQQRGNQATAGTSERQRPRTRTLHFEYDLATARVSLLEEDPHNARLPRWASLSPDEKTVVFARKDNLFMMDADNFAKALKKADDTTIVETQLTTDGVEHYSYGRTAREIQNQREQEQQQQQQQREEGGGEQDDNERDMDDPTGRMPAINLVWSRDSNKFALVRRDSRKVADLWVINALAQPRPTLETYRYSMPGEANIPQSEVHVFDRNSKQRVTVKEDRFPDQTVQIAAAATRNNIQRDPRRPIPAQWLSDTPDKLYFTRLSRDQHRLDVAVADTATGEVKTLIEERLNTYVESKPLRVVNGGTELIFWSERDGWGHFYLYDAATGALKNRITEGEFVTTAIEGVDDKARVLYLSAGGREKGEDPYYTHLYRVGFDGTGFKILNPGDATHSVSVTESARYFVDNASRVNGAPESNLFDVTGVPVLKLETPDLAPLLEAGFKFPEPFSVKADDGITDLYGVMYKPFDFDPSKKYPIIAFVYPGPQTESVTKTFNPRSNNISLAQFGFIVVEVGNRGGHPQRSKWYHNYGYGNLRDYGLADKKAAIEQLAKRHSFIDINRVGIWGHSGGGFMSAAAILVYPDFFKVAWSESGNHENNIYNNSWSEKHHGVKEVEKDGKVTFEYDIEKNSELAKNLKGHLMLITGDIDNNVHPANTYRLADALIKANKRFDMFVLPGVRHSFQPVSGYVNWLRGDYFARHLLGASSENVDIVELNREKEQTGNKRPR